MVERVEVATVYLWENKVGAVAWEEDRGHAVFEYEPDFLKKGLDISPIHMGLDIARQGDGIFSFPGLSKDTYRGLPGLLADMLPDRFGNSIIDTWLTRNGRDPKSFNPIERLCYTGKRGMGALEFSPQINKKFDRSVPVEVTALVKLAEKIMSERLALDVAIGDSEKENSKAIMDILRVGTSAGGARPKAVIAMNSSGNVISGQADVPEGYDYWILKFDGVHDLELGEPKRYGRIEYAYYLMAKAAGLDMAECRLLEENGRAHFMTRRFDRQNDIKIHMQSLCGIAHYNFNRPSAYGYEQAFEVMRKLRLSKSDAIQQYRRMLFNVFARNQDDHTKNISFLMYPDGRWKLSPAFDVVYSHNPAGKWTNRHQMSINGKRDQFTIEDLTHVGESISIPKPAKIINEVRDAVEKWPGFARNAGVKEKYISEIGGHHRLFF
ncbi:MAG: type II toxin-antitoxin system HipA family toxin [Desulfobacterales bacterium]|nr:type II toxin-antitoxin system HipA family toxin [Desulfobacterales bacterium]